MKDATTGSGAAIGDIGTTDEPANNSLTATVELLCGWGELPAFAQQVQEVMAAARAEQYSVGQLSETILGNVSLATKVLKTANSAFYRRIGDTNLTVSRAIALIGWETIRDVAASILLFEHFRTRGVPVRELMLLSLLTANHARELARHTRYPREEEAYLCGMFRGLGEILVACYMPRVYGKIDARIHGDGLSPREASRAAMSFSYDDLARAMVGRWRLGDRVSHCMTRPELVNPMPSGEAELLTLIVAFGHDLSTLVYRVGGVAGRQGTRQLLERWGPGLSLAEATVTKIVAAALGETTDAFASAQVSVASLRQLSQPLTPDVTETALETADSADGRSGEAVGDQEDTTPPGAEKLARLTAGVVSELRTNATLGFNEIMMMIMRTIRLGTGCDRVLFCLVARDGSRLQARMGVGDGAGDLVPRFRFPVSPLIEPLGSVVLKRHDVFVEDTRSSRHASPKFVSVVTPASFGMCPLVIADVVLGALYFDRVNGSLGLDEEMRRSILVLRECANLAFNRMRAS